MGGVNVRCEGEYDVQADVQCTAACRTQASARATCTDPRLAITVTGTVTAAQRARVEALIASLQRNYPRIQANANRLQRVIQVTAPAFVSSLDGLASAATNVGLSASACVFRAGAVAADITNRANASFNVTVEFSASVNAMGTAQ